MDILNDLGWEAFVVHENSGFRCSWFANKSPIVYIKSEEQPLFHIIRNHKKIPIPPCSLEDVFVIPEAYAYPLFDTEAQNLNYVIFNQNTHYTFRNTFIPDEAFPATKGKNEKNPYLDSNNLGTIVVSEQNKRYLKTAFPKSCIYRIHNSIDYNIFSYQENKRLQIAYMPRKCADDVKQVIQILRERNQLQDWSWVPIADISEKSVAKVLKNSALFLSFSHQEGLPLPPKEAMAAGCVVIGYRGSSGKEYMKKPFVYPIADNEILQFALTVEKIALKYKKNPKPFQKITKAASAFIQEKYSKEKEKQDLAFIWKSIERKLTKV